MSEQETVIEVGGDPATGLDGITKEIRDKLAANQSAIAEATSEENLKRLVGEAVGELAESDPEFVRKFRFDGGEDADEVDAKFRGLDAADLEYLQGTQTRVAEKKGAPGTDMSSDELKRAVKAANKRAVKAANARAMDTAESGYGSQLIGAQYASSLWNAARNSATIAQLIRQFPMSAPTTYLPVEVDFPEMLYVSESTANNSSNYSTVKTGSQRVTVSASKFVWHQMWSGEMEEDSLIPFVPFLRRQLTLAVSHYLDSLIMNGDDTNAATGNINLDDADPADTKHYLAFDGIRHAALVDDTSQSVNVAGALTYEDLINAKDTAYDSTHYHMWGYPQSPADWVYTADPETYTQVSLLDEVLTVDKMGSMATNVAGMQGSVAGHPLIPTPVISKTEADGKVSDTGSNNTLGQIVAFNRNGYALGVRRPLMVEFERLPATDQTRLVASARYGLGRFTPDGGTSYFHTVVLRNITLT